MNGTVKGPLEDGDMRLPLPYPVCKGLNYDSPRCSYIEVLAPVSPNVTLFGNTVIAGKIS